MIDTGIEYLLSTSSSISRRLDEEFFLGLDWIKGVLFCSE
jgi:hypothetical protein